MVGCGLTCMETPQWQFKYYDARDTTAAAAAVKSHNSHHIFNVALFVCTCIGVSECTRYYHNPRPYNCTITRNRLSRTCRCISIE